MLALSKRPNAFFAAESLNIHLKKKNIPIRICLILQFQYFDYYKKHYDNNTFVTGMLYRLSQAFTSQVCSTFLLQVQNDTKARNLCLKEMIL